MQYHFDTFTIESQWLEFIKNERETVKWTKYEWKVSKNTDKAISKCPEVIGGHGSLQSEATHFVILPQVEVGHDVDPAMCCAAVFLSC